MQFEDLEQILSPFPDIHLEECAGDELARLPSLNLDEDLETYAIDEGDDFDLYDVLGNLESSEKFEARDIMESFANIFELSESIAADEAEENASVQNARKRKATASPATVMATQETGATTAVAVTPVEKRVRKEVTCGHRKGDKPQRTVPWRRLGSDENERMRAAVWVYRFAPNVKSKTVQKSFGIAVKSLMRYVYDSTNPAYQPFGIYFGPAGDGVAGRADRALKRTEGRVRAKKIGYVVDASAPGVPELARQFFARNGGGAK